MCLCVVVVVVVVVVVAVVFSVVFVFCYYLNICLFSVLSSTLNQTCRSALNTRSICLQWHDHLYKAYVASYLLPI